MNQVRLILVGILGIGLLLLCLGLYLAFNQNPPIAIQKTPTNPPTISGTTPQQTPVQISKTISVPMSDPWTNTNINVAAGQSIVITASGTGVWKNIAFNNPNAVPSPFEKCSPEGTSPNVKDYWSNIHQYQMRANKGALIGKIGEGGLPFKVGSKLTKKVDKTGILFLGINDMKQDIDSSSYNDNEGGFQAQVQIK